MKLYVASSYEDRDRSIALMRSLEGAGHTITSTWLREAENVGTLEDRRRAADVDLADVARADAVVAYTRAPKKEPRGTLVEIGFALGQSKPVFWIGDIGEGVYRRSECIFYDATGVYKIVDIDDLLSMLAQMQGGARLVEPPITWTGRADLEARCEKAETSLRHVTDNLTSTQERCTALIDELRALKRAPAPTAAVLGRIAIEREKQNAKWKRAAGYWRDDDRTKLAVLAEEFGEVARAILEHEPDDSLREELIQCSAVAACWAEDFETDARSTDPTSLRTVNE